jgi:hypothetical protein
MGATRREAWRRKGKEEEGRRAEEGRKEEGGTEKEKGMNARMTERGKE